MVSATAAATIAAGRTPRTLDRSRMRPGTSAAAVTTSQALAISLTPPHSAKPKSSVEEAAANAATAAGRGRSASRASEYPASATMAARNAIHGW